MKKRTDGRYCKNIVIGKDENGRRKMKTIYGKTKKEVADKEFEIKSKLKNGVYIENDKITVGEWADKWFNTYKKGAEHKTTQMYEGAIKNHIKPAIGNVLLSKLKTIQIQEMLNGIVDEGHIRTAEICKMTTSQLVKQAHYESLISRDVMFGVKLITPPKNEKRPLRSEEISAINKANLTPKERAFIDIIWFAGLRRGEALALTVSDLKVACQKIDVNKSLYFENGKGGKIKSPKSKSGYREIPVPEFAFSRILEYVKTLNGFNLFTMRNGQLMSQSSFRRFWDGIMKKIAAAAVDDKSEKVVSLINEKAGFDFTPHTFRHTYATDLYYAGVDVKTAQYLLGHSSADITLKIYTHLDKNKVGAIADKLGDYYNKTKAIC